MFKRNDRESARAEQSKEKNKMKLKKFTANKDHNEIAQKSCEKHEAKIAQ